MISLRGITRRGKSVVGLSRGYPRYSEFWPARWNAENASNSNSSGFGSDPEPNTSVISVPAQSGPVQPLLPKEEVPLPSLPPGCGVNGAAPALRNLRANIDLSYGSQLHCYLFTILGRPVKPLGDLTWSDIEHLLPEKKGLGMKHAAASTFISAIKEIDFTNQRIDYPNLLEIMYGLKERYPNFKPTSLILKGNDPVLNDEIIDVLIRKMQKGGFRKSRKLKRRTRRSYRSNVRRY
jgi:hypothetical protein